MHDKKQSVLDKWGREVIALARSWSVWKWLGAALVVVLAVLFVPTMAELIVGVQNRYSTYPAGTDTSMLAKTIGLTGVFSLAAAFIVGYMFRLVSTHWYVVVSALLLSAVVCISDDKSIVIELLALPVFIFTIFLSFRTKLVVLVPVLAFIIALLARSSYVPGNWCERELTIYPCRPAQETQYGPR